MRGEKAGDEINKNTTGCSGHCCMKSGHIPKKDEGRDKVATVNDLQCYYTVYYLSKIPIFVHEKLKL